MVYCLSSPDPTLQDVNATELGIFMLFEKWNILSVCCISYTIFLGSARGGGWSPLEVFKVTASGSIFVLRSYFVLTSFLYTLLRK